MTSVYRLKISDSKSISSRMSLLYIVMLLVFSSEYYKEINSVLSLKSFDEKLTDFFKFPENYSDYGKHLLSTLERINNTIKLFISVIEKKDKNIPILKEAKNLRVQGGPLFLKVKMKPTKIDTIRTSCNWEIKDVENMFVKRVEVKNTWRRFYKLYRKNKLWLERCFIEAGVRVNVNISYHLRLQQQRKQNLTFVNSVNGKNINNRIGSNNINKNNSSSISSNSISISSSNSSSSSSNSSRSSSSNSRCGKNNKSSSYSGNRRG